MPSGKPREAAVRVLVLAGDAETASERCEIVAKSGHAHAAVVWPEDIQHLLDAHAPDVLLVAAARDERWWLEFCADLRLLEAGLDLPVILVISGDDVDDLIELGLRAGADDVVRAAIGPGELEARIAVQLRNKRHAEALRSLRSERDSFKTKATVDPLTKVLNRGALEEALAGEFARGAAFAVMFVDVDHFKSVNDTFGHDVGDAVLRELGDYLRRSIRGNDIAGRYGGEEFVICLSGCGKDVAPLIAERHRVGVAKIAFPPGHPERITASIGVAAFDPDVPDPSMASLLKRADSAVYQAKRAGRNRVIVAPALQTKREDRESATLAETISKTPITLAPTPKKPTPAEALEAQLVKRLNAGHASLPVIPAVAMAALRMAQKPNASISALAKLIEQDPFIAARFLAVGNSAVYYRGVRTISTRDAIVRMGLGGARDVLSSIAYWTTLPKYHDLLVAFSERAMLAARSAKAVCRVLRWDYEPAYLCGLLHDVGEARVLHLLSGLPTPPEGTSVIVDLVDRYHTQTGAQLAEKWNLHPDIVQACALHHDEGAASKPVRIARMSDLFVRLASKRSPHGPPSADVVACRKLGLTGEQTASVLAALEE